MQGFDFRLTKTATDAEAARRLAVLDAYSKLLEKRSTWMKEN